MIIANDGGKEFYQAMRNKDHMLKDGDVTKGGSGYLKEKRE